MLAPHRCKLVNVASVVWQIDPREPRRGPTAYERRLHALAQRTAGPDDDSPLYCWAVNLGAGTDMARLAAFLLRRLTGAKSRWPNILDRPAVPPHLRGDGRSAAARPDAPNAPPALRRAVLGLAA